MATFILKHKIFFDYSRFDEDVAKALRKERDKLAKKVKKEKKANHKGTRNEVVARGWDQEALERAQQIARGHEEAAKLRQGITPSAAFQAQVDAKAKETAEALSRVGSKSATPGVAAKVAKKGGKWGKGLAIGGSILAATGASAYGYNKLRRRKTSTKA